MTLYSGRFFILHIAKTDIPAALNVPGAVTRQIIGFGDATGYGKMAGEYFSLAAGTDLAPLLKGLEGGLCQAPHWGHVLEGFLTVTYADGMQETVKGGDLVYLRPGHTVAVTQDADVVLFSPQHEHCAVVEYIRKKLDAS